MQMNFFKLRQDSITRGHDFKISPRHSVIDIGYVSGISQAWNELPPEIINFASLQAFKTLLTG